MTIESSGADDVVDGLLFFELVSFDVVFFEVVSFEVVFFDVAFFEEVFFEVFWGGGVSVTQEA
jgi:hypothetical protein